MWTAEKDRLVADIEFRDFKTAMAFMVHAAMVIEQHNHHPEWSNVYNKVHIELTTHDAGNTITEKDRDLAKAIEELHMDSYAH